MDINKQIYYDKDTIFNLFDEQFVGLCHTETLKVNSWVAKHKRHPRASDSRWEEISYRNQTIGGVTGANKLRAAQTDSVRFLNLWNIPFVGGFAFLKKILAKQSISWLAGVNCLILIVS